MKHLSVLYFFTTLLVGGTSLGIAAFVYVKTKDKTIRYSLYSYTPFTLVVVFHTLIAYIETNIPATYPFVLMILDYFATISLLSLIFVVPASVHYFFSIPHAARRNTLFGGLAALAYMGYHISEFLVTGENLKLAGEYLREGLFIAVMIYCVILEARYYKTIQVSSRRKIERWGPLLLGCSLPGLMYDMFLYEISPFRFYPILYCGLSILLIYYFLTSYSHQSQMQKRTMLEEDFFRTNNISSREQEIITLVLKGYSNQKIAETLYISLHTVKAHLRNIYAKLEVKSRYELMMRVKSVDE